MDGSSNVNVESWEGSNYSVVSEVNVETSYSPLKDPVTIHANESVAPDRFPLDGQSATGDHHGGYPVQVTESYSTGYPHHYQDSPILTEAYDTTLPLGHYSSGTESHTVGYDPNLLVEHYPTDVSVNHGTEYQPSVPVQHYSNNATDVHQLDYSINQNIPVDQHYAVIEADGNVQMTDNNYTLQDAHLSGRENETSAHEVSSPSVTHEPTFVTEQVVETVEPAAEPPQLQPEIPRSLQEVTEIPADDPALVPADEEVPENNNQVEEKSIEVPDTPAESVLNESVSDNVTIYSPVDNVSIDYIVPAADGNERVECIDLVLPVVDSASLTMTDPVSIGLKSPEPLSEAVKEGSSIASVPKRPKSGIIPALIKFEVKKAKPGVSSGDSGLEQDPKSKAPEEGIKTVVRTDDSKYIPPLHVLGRTLENPSQDPGKNVQQPRFCMKVPYRNLTSQIVTKNELAKELSQRAARNYTEPQGGDIFFAKKLTKRLAGHISATAKAKEVKEQQASKSADDDLIAILEGEVDDWTIDQPPPQLIEAAKSPVSNHADPPKLDRAVEREIALRQLSTMPSPRRKKVSSPLKGLRIDLLDPMPGSSKSIPLRKRKIPAEVMMTDTGAPASNGQASTPGPARVEDEKKIVVKEPRIFKTKRSSIMTNGKPVVSSPASEVAPVAVVLAKKPKPVDAAKSAERNLISPPRTYSSRIKKSTYNDDFVFPSTSKSRVVPVVGKTQTPKVVTNAVVSPGPSVVKAEDKSPVKKAERKPKTPVAAKTPVVKAKAVKPATKTPKKPPKKLTEIDRLLMDEGAINMLYSVEKDEEQRRTAGSSPVVEVGPKKRVLKSVRYSQKNLLMKTRLVKSAVQRLKNEPDETTSVSLRGKRSTPGKPPARKTSLDSSVSLDPGSPTQIFTYPPRLHPPAEASRIIRRHSSSSNFSSRSTSPNPSTRPSLGPTSPQPAQEGDLAQAVGKQSRKRSNAIYIRNATPANKNKKKRKSGVDDSIFQPAVSEDPQIDREALKSQMAKNFQQIVKTKASPRVKKSESSDSAASEAKMAAGEEVTACLAEAVTAFIAEDGNVDSSSLPPELPKQSLSAASDASSYSSLVLRLELDCAARAERSVQRTSLRQAYTGLCLHRHEHLVQLEVAPTNTRLPDALSAQVLHELSRALSHLSQDASCRAVLITGTGESFCAGLDLTSLIHDTAEQRRVAATELAEALRRFAGGLARFDKPLMAAVHGPAVGVGVTMLAHCDLVYASSDSSFHAPYARLGQMPEAAAVVTLPQLIGNAATSELLIAGRTFSAPEAQGCGLITRVLDADGFLAAVLPLASSIAAQSSQSMEATKALLRFNSRASIEASLAAETRLLVQHWTSAECQANIRQYLDEYDETK